MTAPLRLPRISLVTPSLDQAPFLRATLESVLAQGYPDLEYVVQDGGSRDGSLEILREFEGKVRFVSGEDGGQADAVNRGLRHATGEVFGYLNSDDVLRPGALRAVGEAFASRPDAVLVYGRASYIDPAGRDLAPCPGAPWDADRLAESCFVSQPAAFWRRSVRDEIGEFDVSLHHAMDYDYWLRIAARYGAGRVLSLDRELAGCRVHPGAKTVAGWDGALEEILELVGRRAGYVSLWWCVAKWDHRVDGRSQVLEPHPVPWRAYPPALLEFLRRNPGRPDLWWRGLRRAPRALAKRLRASQPSAGAEAAQRR